MKNGQNFVLVLIIILSCCVHFWGLNWFTPSKQKNLQIFGTEEGIKKYLPEMLRLRQEFYQETKQIYATLDHDKIAEKIDEVRGHHLKTKPFEVLPQTIVLDAARGYFTGHGDERHTIVALSNINPLKFDFNPDEYAYGGFYFYSAGTILMLGKLLGFVSLPRDIYYYFFNPNEVSKMYILARLLSVLSIIPVILLLYFIVKLFWGRKAALLSTIFLSFSSLTIIYTHFAKPHIYSIFWILLGLYFCVKISSISQRKYYLYAGIAFGLAFGTLITNVMSIFLLLLTDFLKNNSQVKKMFNLNLFLGVSTSLFVFLLVNPYLPFHIKDFFTRSQELSIVFQYGVLNLKSSLFFLQQMFTMQISLIFLPLIISGIIFLSQHQPKQSKLCNYNSDTTKFSKLILVYPLLHLSGNTLFLRHEGVFAMMLPFFSIYFALGVIWLSKLGSNQLRKLSIVYSVVAITFLFVNAIFQSSLFLREGNLTRAGEWINKNIPVSSTIATPDGYFFDITLPPFSFLNYKLVHFPTNLSRVSPEKNKLPQYIISVEDSLDISSYPQIRRYYQLIKSWERKEIFFGITFKKNPLIQTENSQVKIYQLVN